MMLWDRACPTISGNSVTTSMRTQAGYLWRRRDWTSPLRASGTTIFDVPAYLLDLDGTLIDSEPWYKRTEVDALNEFGVPITLEEMEEFTGLTLPVWLDRVHEIYGKRVDQEEFLQRYRPEMERHVRDNVQMFPDAARLLDRLDGHPVSLVTSSMKWYVDAVLERFSELSRFVGNTVCEADVVRGKPDPEPYTLAADRLGLAAAECVVVEDAPNGVKSGLAAGCRVVAIDREGHGRVAFANRVLATLDDLEVASF